MLPTLNGRIQTRIFATLVFGGLWTLIITPFLPIDAPMDTAYKTTYIILLTVTVLGVGWEVIYHLLQQFRWEKDWPTFFGLVTIVPEGLLIWALLRGNLIPGIVGTIPASAFIIDFVLVWVAVWLWANGPMRVINIRWRFHGGRLV